jgi:5-methylcytosine-specific restriction endonuclease McrA
MEGRFLKLLESVLAKIAQPKQLTSSMTNCNYDKYGQDLDVYHKIPAKEFDKVDDANYLINLVITCRSCHGKLDKISRREANRKPSISVTQLT